LQLIATGIHSVDAIWFTHAHADHIHGIDDVRVFTVRKGDMEAYVPTEYMGILKDHFRYIFDPSVHPPKGSSKPRVRLREIEAGRPVEIIGETFTPLKAPHGDVAVYGFRVGKLGYVTDAKSLPAEAVQALQDVDVLVLNALWFGKPHASHFNIEEAIEASRLVGARRTYLTHLTHRVTHAELEERLPEHVYAAFDGLVVEID
jgi:phosphoribosyl 1,2-cyclic phosphate phosphodiesterase